MILKEIIVILFFFTFFCNASEQYPTPNALWIVTDLAGKVFQPGDTFDFAVMAPDNYTGTYNINLRNHEMPRAGYVTLLSGISFKGGLNTFNLEIPSNSQLSVPSPVYYIIFWGPTDEDYSATFTIGEPGYGVSIVNPAAGIVLHPGDTFEASWYGTYERPDVEGIEFIHALLEPAENDDFPHTYPFQADRQISFESQYFELKLPTDILAPRVWKFGFLFNTSDGSYSTIVSSGSFLILPNDDDQPPNDSSDPDSDDQDSDDQEPDDQDSDDQDSDDQDSNDQDSDDQDSNDQDSDDQDSDDQDSNDQDSDDQDSDDQDSYDSYSNDPDSYDYYSNDPNSNDQDSYDTNPMQP
ncbi:960_t:CDS:2 [Cetraspora pellucida]|uniref:960_t:CDS:1 n=1 Tax=Cetraspora pellucida TaxID=1433469 RepID=A0A9N9F3I8_9GLOM|nr:960_t:CDS:2 [Cetraspora pellucida]